MVIKGRIQGKLEIMLALLVAARDMHATQYPSEGICCLVSEACSLFLRDVHSKPYLQAFHGSDYRKQWTSCRDTIMQYISKSIGLEGVYLDHYLKTNNLPHDKNTLFMCRQAWMDKMIFDLEAACVNK